MERTEAMGQLKNLSDQDELQNDLLDWIGDHADVGTPRVLRSALRRATEADLVSVREAMRGAKPEKRGAWIIGALKARRLERIEENRPRTPTDDMLQLVDELRWNCEALIAGLDAITEILEARNVTPPGREQ